ncbi:MAG TPA: c-type cytochrome [Solirubrobacterales bacterium]|nr:c-type cytochrome [Solirubrobacterales bacterium]
MRRNGWKSMLMEGWALIAVAVLAFIGGLLIGDLGASPEKETVYVSNAAEEGGSEAGEATEAEGAEPKAEGEGGAQLFTSIGCGGCHTLSAAKTTGTTGPNLNESLATDDDTQGIEEMIIHPNSEVVEGYAPNVMPQNYGESLSESEVHELAEFLVASTKAKPSP